MDHTNQRTLTAGRAAVRWFIFLVFFHLLPVPWFMVVVAGLAPASFLFAMGVAGLFVKLFDGRYQTSEKTGCYYPQLDYHPGGLFRSRP